MNKPTPKTPSIPPRITKSELARMYGFNWKDFKIYVYDVIPALKETRRHFLFPKEVKAIFEALGRPSNN